MAVAQANYASAKGSGAAVSCTIPAATAGNLLIAYVCAQGATVTVSGIPSGWAAGATNANGTSRFDIYYGYATAGQTSVAFTLSASPTSGWGVAVVEYTGATTTGNPFSTTPFFQTFLSAATMTFTPGSTIGTTGSYMSSAVATHGTATGFGFSSAVPGGAFTVNTPVVGSFPTVNTTSNLLILGAIGTTSLTTWTWVTSRIGEAYVFAIKGRQVLSGTATESISTLTESLTRGAKAPRTVSETISSLTETVTTTVKRTPSESMTTLTDAAVVASILSHAATDAVSTLTDSATRIAYLVQKVTDNVSTLTDAASGKSKLQSTGSDSITPLTDTISRQVLLPRTVVEDLHYLREVVSIARSALRGVSDNASTMTEVVKAGRVYHASVSDVISHLSETIAFYSIHSRTTGGETMTITDSAGRLTKLTRVVGETMYYYDTTSRVVIYRTMRVWNGTRWIPSVARVWDGAQWAITKPHRYTNQGWTN